MNTKRSWTVTFQHDVVDDWMDAYRHRITISYPEGEILKEFYKGKVYAINKEKEEKISIEDLSVLDQLYKTIKILDTVQVISVKNIFTQKV